MEHYGDRNVHFLNFVLTFIILPNCIAYGNFVGKLAKIDSFSKMESNVSNQCLLFYWTCCYTNKNKVILLRDKTSQMNKISNIL